MKSYTYDNRITITWDDTLKEGDLVTAYPNGYHQFIRYEEREGSPLAYFRQVVNKDGKKLKKPGVEQVCDASYVRRVTKADIEAMYNREVEAAATKNINLHEFARE